MTDDTQQPADPQAQNDDDPLASAQQEIERLKDMAARAQADLQNAKTRMEREAGEIRMYAVSGLIEKLLPTIDNFRRAVEHLPEDLKHHEWVKGIQATEQHLMRDLGAVGLKSLNSLGSPVDPHRHEVLQTAPGKAETIVQVLEEGYELNGKILRHAKVVAGTGEMKNE